MAKKKKKSEKREIPLKNYIILGIIFGACILFVIYISSWYYEYSEYQKTIPIMRGVVPEITNVELSHYVQENETAFIYLCVPSNDECRKFENNLKRLIEKRELKDDITYLNLENDTEAISKLEDFQSQYDIKQDLTRIPSFILFENQEVTAVLQGTAKRSLSIGDVEQFLDLHNIGE